MGKGSMWQLWKTKKWGRVYYKEKDGDRMIE